MQLCGCGKQLYLLHCLLTAPFWLKSKESEVGKSGEINEEEGKDHSSLSEESIADKNGEETKREGDLASGSSTGDKVLGQFLRKSTMHV